MLFQDSVGQQAAAPFPAPARTGPGKAVPGQPDRGNLQRRDPDERGPAAAGPVGRFPELYHASHTGEGGRKIALFLVRLIAKC